MTRPNTVPRVDQPCFLVICRDGPNSAAPRRDHLKGHLDHVEKHWERYITAGPIREPGKEELVGSVFLVLAESLEDAQALMNGDPYLTCGMYESIEYKEFTNAIGRFIGGKTWESAEAVAHVAAGGPTKLSSGS
ncbi:YciI family protein [Hyphomonas sp.]|uniref:YciI family protein n=1 Tax=Hyphomonas sp. TaxID=87 RepID=UPI0025BD90DF|nr:YciI family protein [Hyphomonas sp.]